MIWIIGEYAERIDNADELLESFLDGFQDENTQVQLQLLTAIVKLFLKRPTDTQELVQQVLSLATQVSKNAIFTVAGGVSKPVMYFNGYNMALYSGAMQDVTNPMPCSHRIPQYHNLS